MCIRIELVRLTTLHWFDKFNRKLKEAQDKGARDWPYISHKKCHHGAWIKRVKKEKLFDDCWLETLEHDHEAMHACAEALIHKHQAINTDITTDDIENVNRAFGKMIVALEHYEIAAVPDLNYSRHRA